MKALGGVIGAVIGGAVGAAIWAAIVHFTGYEVGWIAWGIGALVGVGALTGTRLAGGVPNSALPILAAVIALASVLVGKYAAVEIVIRNMESASGIFADLTEDEEYLISEVADSIVNEREEAGETIVWPDVAGDEESWEAEYPADVWAEAETRWNAMSPSERSALADVANQEMQEIAGDLGQILRTEGFKNSFGLFDILWILLAVGTAWKIAAEADD